VRGLPIIQDASRALEPGRDQPRVTAERDAPADATAPVRDPSGRIAPPARVLKVNVFLLSILVLS